MNIKKILLISEAKTEFGQQLKKYREVTGLTQEEYAEYHGTSQSYITNLENGFKDIQIDTMQKHASSFGVNHYQLSNPDFPIPSLEEMPLEIQSFVTAAIKLRMDNKEKKREQKEKGEKDNLWSGKKLHELIGAGFFNEKRTSKEAFLELNTNPSDNELTNDHKQEIGKITSTLSKGKFKKKLAKIKSASGETAVRFIAKEHMTEGDRASEIK